MRWVKIKRERGDGVINDGVFNTLYGLAYKLRPVHRSLLAGKALTDPSRSFCSLLCAGGEPRAVSDLSEATGLLF